MRWLKGLIVISLFLILITSVSADYKYILDTQELSGNRDNPYSATEMFSDPDAFCQKITIKSVSVHSPEGIRNGRVMQAFKTELEGWILTDDASVYDETKTNDGSAPIRVRVAADFFNTNNPSQVRNIEYQFEGFPSSSTAWIRMSLECTTNGDADGDRVCDPGITQTIATAQGITCDAYGDECPLDSGSVYTQGCDLGNNIVSIEEPTGASDGQCSEEGSEGEPRQFCGDNVVIGGAPDDDVSNIYYCSTGTTDHHLFCWLDKDNDGSYYWHYETAATKDEGVIQKSISWDSNNNLEGQSAAYIVKPPSGDNYWELCGEATPPSSISCTEEPTDTWNAYFCCEQEDDSCTSIDYHIPTSRGAGYKPARQYWTLSDGEVEFDEALGVKTGDTLRLKVLVTQGTTQPIELYRVDGDYTYLVDNNILDDIKFQDIPVEYRVTMEGNYDKLKFMPEDSIESVYVVEVFNEQSQTCDDNSWENGATSLSENGCTPETISGSDLENLYLQGVGPSSGNYCCGAEKSDELYFGEKEVGSYTEKFICQDNVYHQWNGMSPLKTRARSKVVFISAQERSGET